MREERAKLSRGNDVAKAMDYMLKRSSSFARFLDDGRICLTNNAAERALRGIALAASAPTRSTASTNCCRGTCRHRRRKASPPEPARVKRKLPQSWADAYHPPACVGIGVVRRRAVGVRRGQRLPAQVIGGAGDHTGDREQLARRVIRARARARPDCVAIGE